MDHADPPLAGSPEPLHDSVAGTDAGPGENYAMNPHPTSTEMSWGRGTAPLPQTPSPKTKFGRLHKSLDTPPTHCSLDLHPIPLHLVPHSFHLTPHFAL